MRTKRNGDKGNEMKHFKNVVVVSLMIALALASLPSEVFGGEKKLELVGVEIWPEVSLYKRIGRTNDFRYAAFVVDAVGIKIDGVRTAGIIWYTGKIEYVARAFLLNGDWRVDKADLEDCKRKLK